MKIDWRPYDPFEAASNPNLFGTGVFSFDDYLTSTVIFLETEKKKYEKRVEELESQNDTEDTPIDLQIAYFELQGFSELENTIFSSFFVMIYSYLESELTQYCHDLEKHAPKEQLWSDISGRQNILDRVKEYLTKVQKFDFPSNSPEWEKIRNFTNLRNCIVHNQGRLNDSFKEEQREKLSQFIQGKNSKIKLQDDKCMIDREFCSDALDTIRKFLLSVAAAKKLQLQ